MNDAMENTDGPAIFMPELDEALRKVAKNLVEDIDDEDILVRDLCKAAMSVVSPVLDQLRHENKRSRRALQNLGSNMYPEDYWDAHEN